MDRELKITDALGKSDKLIPYSIGWPMRSQLQQPSRRAGISSLKHAVSETPLYKKTNLDLPGLGKFIYLRVNIDWPQSYAKLWLGIPEL